MTESTADCVYFYYELPYEPALKLKHSRIRQSPLELRRRRNAFYLSVSRIRRLNKRFGRRR